MALSDPQSVTISGTAVPLARTGLALTEGKFGDTAGQVDLSVAHSKSKRVRDVVRLSKTAVVSDPLVPTQNQNVSFSAHLVIDRPRNGVDATEAAGLADALVKWATPANLAKVIAGES